MTDISSYLSFVLKLFFAFGLAFEVPVATVLLVRMGMTTPESLAAKRPYIIVGAFVVGMLMTPPDIFSQLMLAIPVWVLFELGLYVSKSIKPQTRAQADAASVEDEALDREMEAGIAEFDRLDDDDPSSRS
jgi:sec-independent protein translocase protein TatC